MQKRSFSENMNMRGGVSWDSIVSTVNKASQHASKAITAANLANERANATIAQAKATKDRINQTAKSAKALVGPVGPSGPVGPALQVPKNQSVISTPADLKCSALVSVQARYVKPHAIISVPVYLLETASTTQSQRPVSAAAAQSQRPVSAAAAAAPVVTARQLEKNTMVSVTPQELKPRSAVTVRAMDVHPEAVIQQVPAGSVHPDTLVQETPTGMATVSSLAEPSAKIPLAKVSAMLPQQLKTVSPTSVKPTQPVKVSAQEVINLNADVIPAGSKKALPLAEALNQGMPADYPVTVEAKHVNPAAQAQVPKTVKVGDQKGMTAGQLDQNTVLAATQPAVDPELLVSVKPKDIQAAAIVAAPSQAIRADTQILPPQLLNAQSQDNNLYPNIQSVRAAAQNTQNAQNANALYPTSFTRQQMRADQVPLNQTVVAQTSALIPGASFPVPAHLLKPNVQVTQGPGALMTRKAQIQQAQSSVNAGEVSAENPELTVRATSGELVNGPVLVPNSAVLPSQQNKVVQVSPTQSIASRSQLKPGPVSVQVQNVKAGVPLELNPTDGVFNTPLAGGQRGGAGQKGGTGQRGGAGSDFVSSFYSSTNVNGIQAISAATLQGIDNAPMFHPLDPLAVVPTMPSTGIFPTGMQMALNGSDNPILTGGGRMKRKNRAYQA